MSIYITPRLGRIVLLLVLLLPVPTLAEEITTEQIKGLDEQVQEIKEDVIGIAAELSRLEEKLLYPSNTHVAFFVSLARQDKTVLNGIKLVLDNQVVAKHLYTFRELEALSKGGVQRLYTGNIRTGVHKLEVTVTGKSAAGEKFRHSASYQVKKEVGPKIVEVRLEEPASGKQGIGFKDW